MNHLDIMLVDSPLLKRADANTNKQVIKSLKASQESVLARTKLTPSLIFPDTLPVSIKKQEIKNAISNHQVVIVSGETGSGKTTQLPKICLDLGLACRGMIGHTQPRRLAAQTIARRLADECQCELGQQIGFQIRFTDKTNPRTLVKLMTDGILLSEIKADPLLLKYQTIIIDEAHERSLNVDFLLGYIKSILPKRPDLKLIITSATIDTEKFCAFFNDAPLIHVSGRTYPIETYYLDNKDIDNKELPELILDKVRDIEKMERDSSLSGHILIFLPTEQSIYETQKYLTKHHIQKKRLLPLFSRLEKDKQTAIFKPSSYQKIILSTNIAETSLTIPGVRYVIDSGLVRISRFNYRNKIQQLPIEYISQASANQRQGRCGREGPGVCFRLFSEQTFQLMKETTEAEILRTNLSAVLLMSLDLNLGDLNAFNFLDQPDFKAIRSAFNSLEELGALNERKNLNKCGRQLARLNIDPRLGRMIIAAKENNSEQAICVIAAFLAIQDPREMPINKKDQAKQMHARFSDKKCASDFYSIILLWQYYQEQCQLLTRNQLRKKLQKEYLNFFRLKEWGDLTYQLLSRIKVPYQEGAISNLSLDNIHQACLSGLLSHIGIKDQDKTYKGARNRKFKIFPGSYLYKKTPVWLMCGFLVETNHLYGRICSEIDPSWTLQYANHLIKEVYSEPHWSHKNKRSMIYCTKVLYGLPVQENIKVPLTSVDSVLAREIFIRSVLVSGMLDKYTANPPRFWRHNQTVLKTLADLEAKFRRLDYQCENTLFNFYSKNLPDNIFDVNSLMLSVKSHGEKLQSRLLISKSMFIKDFSDTENEAQYPDELVLGGHSFQISYHYDPNAEDDGVSIHVPIDKLSLLSENILSYLVPGLVAEKSIALLKTLPKKIRKMLAPIPELVSNILFDSKPDGSEHILQYLIKQIFAQKKVLCNIKDFKVDKLDKYYTITIKIINENHKVINQGDNLNLLQKHYHKKKSSLVENQCTEYVDTINIDNWQLQSINSTNNSEFNSLELKQHKVVLVNYLNPNIAQHHTKKALCYILKQKLKKECASLLKDLFKSKRAALVISQSGNVNDLKAALLETVLSEVFLDEHHICDNQKLQEVIRNNINTFFLQGKRFEESLLIALELKQKVTSQLNQLHNTFEKSKQDMVTQLNKLFCINYIEYAGMYINDYPRYLKALQNRIEKLPRQPDKDLNSFKQVRLLEKKLDDFLEQNQQSLLVYPSVKKFRFLLEELRISFFDQTIKTKEKVSIKRLEKTWMTYVVEKINF